MTDTKADILKILDEADLTASNLLQGKTSMQTIVNKLRLDIAIKVTKYIEENYGAKV